MLHVIALLISLRILFRFHFRRLTGNTSSWTTAVVADQLNEQAAKLQHHSPYSTIRRLIYYWIIWNSRVVHPTLEGWNTAQWVFWANKWYAEVKANNRVGL
jgi:hypothetical protein